VDVSKGVRFYYAFSLELQDVIDFWALFIYFLTGLDDQLIERHENLETSNEQKFKLTPNI